MTTTTDPITTDAAGAFLLASLLADAYSADGIIPTVEDLAGGFWGAVIDLGDDARECRVLFTGSEDPDVWAVVGWANAIGDPTAIVHGPYDLRDAAERLTAPRPPAPAAPRSIVGTLAVDPEIRYSREGIATTTLYVVTSSKSVHPRCGVEVVTLTGTLAENAALSLQRGHEVVAVGNMVGDVFTADHLGASLAVATVEIDSRAK